MEMQMIPPEYITLNVQGAADGKAKLDECCKKLLSNRIILAWIMKCTMKEYRDYDPDEICRRFIEGNLLVSMTPVHQDADGNGIRENESHGNRIHGDNTVDESITEGRVTYDIRFRAVVPQDGEIITLIINVEAQADFWPGYPLLTTELGADQKKKHLEKEYGITATEEFDKEMKQMCNYSDYVEQIGIEKGVQKGLIETCKELGVSRDTTLSKLVTKFTLTQTAAEEILKKYW